MAIKEPQGVLALRQPPVTLVIPSFNSGHFLNWTLESVKNQTLQNFECIVVDDCSTDESIAEAKPYFTDPRFRLIRHKANVGLSGARNTGMRAAKGRFVAFLDSDDLLMANSLEVRVATCLWGERKSERFVGSYCGSDQIEENLAAAPSSRPVELPFVDFLSSNGLCPFNANQPMLRRDVLRLSGGFNQELTQAEDFDLWQRILRAGYIFAPAKHVSVTYRKRANSMIRRAPITHLKTSLDLINSSTNDLSDDQMPWGPNRYTKPLYSYAAQERKLDRVMQFSGMNIASPEPASLVELEELAKTELPDLPLIVSPIVSLKHMLNKGVKRQLSRNAPELEPKLDKFCEQLLRTSDPITSAPKLHQAVYSDPPKNRVWFSREQAKFDVVFIPQSAYHVWTISLIAKELSALGVDFVTLDISPEWRDGGVRAAAEKYGLSLVGLSEFVLGQYRPKSIVVFNDWDPVIRPILIAAKASGVRTISIVEGIQDYDDADVHWQRFAYKTTDVVLLPGEFDRKYFKGHGATLDVVGIPRVHELRTAPPARKKTKGKPKVLINSNFSYGVLVEHRDAWLKDVVEEVLAKGMVPVISRHPADIGTTFAKYVTKQTFYEALEECELTVQRFASGILEALARDKGVIYYNPHGEKVDKFTSDPMGAYVVVNSREALKETLQNPAEIKAMCAENGSMFLDMHAGKTTEDAVKLCATKLAEHLVDATDETVWNDFRELLAAVDWRTHALHTVREDNQPIFPDPSKAEPVLRRIHAEMRKATQRASNMIIQADVLSTGEEIRTPKPARKVATQPTTKKSATQLAADLLLSPEETLPRLAHGGDLHAEAARLEAGSDPASAHFRKVLDWAKRKVG